MNYKALVKANPIIWGVTAQALRTYRAVRLILTYSLSVLRWLIRSRETTNFTYGLYPHNVRELGHFIGNVVDVEFRLAQKYIDELNSDTRLRRHVRTRTSGLRRLTADSEAQFAKRAAYYAIIRLQHPAVVVESGVDKGLGTCAMAAALLRNKQEGFPGKIYAIDIDPKRGWLIGPPYDSVIEFMLGDSQEQLRRITEPIGLYIHDSLRQRDYEQGVYSILGDRLTDGAIVVTASGHHSSVLMELAESAGERYYSWREAPVNHFYPGAGLGAARFTKAGRRGLQ